MSAGGQPGPHDPFDDEREPDMLRDMADPAAYEGVNERRRLAVTAVWCSGATLLCVMFAIVGMTMGASILYVGLFVVLAVVLGIAAGRAIGRLRRS